MEPSPPTANHPPPTVQTELSRLSALIDSMSDEVWFADQQGRFTLANPSARHEFCLAAGEEVTVAQLASTLEVLRPDGSPRPLEEAPPLRALAGEVITQQEELVRTPATGELRYRQVSATPVRDAAGIIIGSISVARDITAQKMAELALRAALDFSQSVISTMQDGFVVMELHGVQTEANPALCKMTGFSREELVGAAPPHPFWPPEEYPQIREAFKQTLNGEIHSFELTFMRKNGERFPVILSPAPVKNSQGAIISFTATVKDISERKQAELLLEENQRQLTTLLSNLPGMAYRCRNDRDWTMSFTSTGCLELTGYTAEDLVDNRTISYADLILPNDVEPVWNEVQLGLLEKRPFRMNYRIRTAEGKEKWVWEQGQGVFAADGSLTALEGFIVDITQRIKAEEKIKLLQQAIEQSATSVVITDLSGRIEYVNPAFEKASGYAAAELLGRFPRVLKSGHQDAAFYRELWTTITAGRVWRGQFHNKRKDGSFYWELATISPVLNASGEIIRFIGVKENISELKSLESRLRTALDQAEGATRAKSEFLASMSHEIRTPLSGVLGLAQILMHEPLTADQHEMVERINASGDSLLGIINDVLDFSKIEAGQLRIETRPFKLSALLNHLQSIIGVSAHGKGLTLRITDPAPIAGSLIGDPLRLEQVLLNLVSNAIKFTAQGEVAVRVSPLTVTEQTIRLRFEVQDSGIGIAAADLTELFTPFTQVDQPITQRFGGTGLGLSICKRLVESMGGTLGVESTLGAGSTFWFELPFGRTEDEILPVATASQSTGPRLQGLHVLVADDSEVNLFLVERLLQREGAKATLVKDGQQAVERLKAQPDGFDAVLMDVQMPVMDGLTATRVIRETLKLSQLPVIALTAGVLPRDRENALANGLDDYLSKPLDHNLMVQILARLCQRTV